MEVYADGQSDGVHFYKCQVAFHSIVLLAVDVHHHMGTCLHPIFTTLCFFYTRSIQLTYNIRGWWMLVNIFWYLHLPHCSSTSEFLSHSLPGWEMPESLWCAWCSMTSTWDLRERSVLLGENNKLLIPILPCMSAIFQVIKNANYWGGLS